MHSLFDATVTTREARIAFRRKLEADAVVSGARDSGRRRSFRLLDPVWSAR